MHLHLTAFNSHKIHIITHKMTAISNADIHIILHIQVDSYLSSHDKYTYIHYQSTAWNFEDVTLRSIAYASDFVNFCPQNLAFVVSGVSLF